MKSLCIKISVFKNCSQNREQDIQFYEDICNNKMGYVRLSLLTYFHFKILLTGVNQLHKFLIHKLLKIFAFNSSHLSIF